MLVGYAMLCYAMLVDEAMLCYAGGVDFGGTHTHEENKKIGVFEFVLFLCYAMLILMLCYAVLCLLCYALCYACYAMLCWLVAGGADFGGTHTHTRRLKNRRLRIREIFIFGKYVFHLFCE